MLAGKTLNPDHKLTMFIRDALRFISAFITPISQSAPQIYVSSLSFAPEQSLVATEFRSRFPNTIVVTEGKPSQWPMTVFTAEHHKDGVHCLVFSPDESTFASISDDEIMCVCDSEIGLQQNIFYSNQTNLQLCFHNRSQPALVCGVIMWIPLYANLFVHTTRIEVLGYSILVCHFMCQSTLTLSLLLNTPQYV